MVRYFMTIPEAVGLVLQSCAQGGGGDIFVLDMGQPIQIAALARQMIELSGLQPDVDIEIKYVGLRPGEKLFEELQCRGEGFRPTRHPRIMSFIHQPEPLALVQSALARLEEEMYSIEAVEVKKRILRLVPEYAPYLPTDSCECAPSETPESPAIEAGIFRPLQAVFVQNVPAAMAGV
jgi:FlaA1/EpsC-like NDP-sugar epimerase